MYTLHILMFWSILLILCVSSSCGNESIVGIILLVSNSSQYNTTQSIQQVQTALGEVNDRSDLLPDIKMEIITVVESKCGYSSAASLYEVFTTLSTHDVPTIAILNGGCPSLSSLLADTEKLTDLLKLSFSPGTSTTNSQSSITLFPNPSTTISIISSLLRLNGWKKMSLITSIDGIFSKYHRSLVTELESHDISLIDTFVILPDSDFDYVITNLSSRIIFLDVYEDTAQQILCKAYRGNMYYPYYEWILHGWYSENWLANVTSVNCSKTDLLRTIDRAIAIEEYSQVEIPSTNNASDQFDTSDKHLPFLPSLVHDTVYSLALALDQSVKNNINFTNNCFSTKRECMLHQQILETSFIGKSGEVKFDENGDRVLLISKLFQYRTENDSVFTTVFAEAQPHCDSNSYDVILLANVTNATLWAEVVPFDGSPLEKIVSLPLTAVIPIYIMATVGIICAIICILFTLIFRNRKIIRLTSPNLNYFVDVGAIILYMSLYVRMLPTGDIRVWDVMCHALVWTNTLGIALCFSPVLVKVWRVYYIFKNPTSKKKNIKDIYLITVVLIISGTALVFLIIGTVVPGIRPEAYHTSFLEDPFSENEYGIRINHIGINCFTTLSFAWVVFLSLCITVIEFVALILAIKTRNIKIKALNDSKEISVIVYVTTIGSLEAFIVALVLQGFDTLSEGLLSTAFFIITSTILGLVHIPKMVSLYKDPKGLKVFDNNILTVASQSLGSQPNIYEKTKIPILEKRIATLEQMLQQNGHATVYDNSVNEQDNDS